MTTFIDFKELREQLVFAEVLATYGVTVGGDILQHQGLCPLPTHQGVRNRPSFSANLTRKVWRCFGCKTSGNALDFAVRMEGLDPENSRDVRRVALKLMKTLAETEPRAHENRHAAREMPGQSPVLVVNAPLDFALKGLDASHEAVASLGLGPATVERFGLGYCSRGLLQGRIAIPLHNERGELVGYAGRLPNGKTVSATEPLYRFPSERVHNGATHRFSPDLLVYGAHWIDSPPAVVKLLVGEDFSLVWHLWELGVAAVALPTSRLSPVQEETLGRLVVAGGLVFVGQSSVR